MWEERERERMEGRRTDRKTETRSLTSLALACEEETIGEVQGRERGQE